MIKKQEVVNGLWEKKMTLELSEWGDGMRGVGLYNRGDRRPVERIAMISWLVSPYQPQDEMIYADDDCHAGYEMFGAGELSTQARDMLVRHCQRHSEAIIAWCSGDETAVLPPIDYAICTVDFDDLPNETANR